MLYICSSIKKYQEFKNLCSKTHDLSKIPSSQLVIECESIVDHHSSACIFLGYLEPGWMLSSTDQTRIRKLIRKFDVYMVSYFPESIPHSWKNEIHTFYTQAPLNQNGNSNSINDGGSVQDKSTI